MPSPIKAQPQPLPSQFFPYGTTQCLPAPSPQLIEQSTQKNATCAAYAPAYGAPRARVGLVTAHFGPVQQHYQRALESHLMHSLIHGTQVHVLCDTLVDDLWNKHAFILDMLMREILKPADERLEWVMWADRDTLILDQCRPLSSFLPPVDTNRNIVVTTDWNGLNNGIFFLRVNKWAIDLFTATLAYRYYRPEVFLRFTEQSAMQNVLTEATFAGGVQWVPQHWFNAYDMSGAYAFANRTAVADLHPLLVRRGDFLLHFAGQPNKNESINEWMDMLEVMENVWEAGSAQRNLTEEVTAFWKALGLRW
ncbi:glycosyltransferase family 34 protein [Dothidotthia symphoricarpi CBS 119687]|uniref:Glycosyltransferase family 34 protein n=1 Tax=Dothidotthia symphoricarpi CBS 119687 TaxID=1392245 RepID=A0A6A6A7N0_9PLEO|nr:glycosyltransferase family 34 protein [Dothidotthia symphoricarpi CBS 119687]KAF2127163.1 glycosyltransferase family 34 protein [Dothidotthia symphoricarpi CBS 119687]